jgi:hypothetical protein
VGGEVGDPELPPPQLPAEGVGRADVLHGAPQHAAHPGGRRRRRGVLLLLLVPLARGRGSGSVWLRRLLRRRGLRPVLLGLGAVGRRLLLLLLGRRRRLRGVGRLVVLRLAPVAGGPSSHGVRSGATVRSAPPQWSEVGRRRRRGRGGVGGERA